MKYLKTKLTLKIFFSLLILLFAIPSYAFAYIDPNAGNIVFQILFPVITTIATVYIFCKKGIYRMANSAKDWLSRKLFNKECDN